MRSSGRPLDQRQSSSFEGFYRSDYRAVLVLARVLTGDPHVAEDVAHDAFAAAWQDWKHLDNPSAWVRRVVVNKAKSSWRRRYAERRAMTSVAAETPDRHEMPAETETFWAQVRRLPAGQAPDGDPVLPRGPVHRRDRRRPGMRPRNGPSAPHQGSTGAGRTTWR